MNASTIEILSRYPRDITRLDISGMDIRGTLDMFGFDRLEFLDCSVNRIDQIIGLPSCLKNLVCFGNRIVIASNLTLPDSLVKLNCSANLSLQNLPDLPPGLKKLDCSDCPLRKLNSLPEGLVELNCDGCGINQLDNLPGSLEVLSCGYNNLTSLDNLAEGLEILLCHGNLITSLDSLPSTLIKLDCNQCRITHLDNLPAGLKILYCSHNFITSLESLPSGLMRLIYDESTVEPMVNVPPGLFYTEDDVNPDANQDANQDANPDADPDADPDANLDCYTCIQFGITPEQLDAENKARDERIIRWRSTHEVERMDMILHMRSSRI